jgi:hypothetical protein
MLYLQAFRGGRQSGGLKEKKEKHSASRDFEAENLIVFVN